MTEESIAATEGVTGAVADWCASHPVRLCVLYGSRARGEERVDSDLDPVLGHQIAREGSVLYQQGPDVWPREQLRLWQLYQDSLPFLRASHRRLRRFAEKVRSGA